MKESNLTRQRSADILRGLTDPSAARSLSWVEEMANDSGDDIPEGAVVVVVADGTIELADTVNDPRPTGVALDDIDAGDTGQVCFGGPVDMVLTTGAVTAGQYGQTSTTPGEAQVAAGPGTAFCEFTESTTNPPAFLWGGRGGGGVFSGVVIEDFDTDETDVALVLHPDGTGGVEWGVDATGSALPWFVVTDPAYGATGDGTTDDLAAINLAIAALNAAGAGVLYFPTPADAYRCTGALTTITADCIVMGDGSEGDHQATRARPTLIECTSATAVLFTMQVYDGLFKDLVIRNTAAGTPSAGAGISVQSPGGSTPESARVSFDNVKVEDFYDCFDIQVGSGWYMRGCMASSAVRYCIRVRNVVNGDFGDWTIADSWIYGYTHTPTAGLRIESSGGGRVVNCKFIFPGNYGIDIVGGASTSNLQVSNTSIESYVTTGVRSVGLWPHQIYANVQFGQYANGGSYGNGHAMDLSGNTDVIIDDLVLRTDASTKTAIVLSSMTRCAIGQLTNNGFTTLISGTPDQDSTGGVGARVFITGTPSAGQVPVASGAAAAAWQSLSAAGIAPSGADYLVGTTQAGLSGEIVVGTTPGGELGGTWASPTVDATHSGSAHTEFIAKTIVDSKGDLIGASANDTPVRVPVGTDGQLLQADSSAAAGVSFVDAPSSGGAHAHVASETHLSDGASDTYTLDEVFEPGSVIAWNVTSLARLAVAEAAPDQAVVSPVGSAGDSIVFDYAASVA